MSDIHRVRRSDRMVGSFTTTCAIRVYQFMKLFESRSWRDVSDTTLCDKVCQYLAAGWWVCLATTVSPTNKIDRHDIEEIFLKVALNTITHNIFIFIFLIFFCF